MRRLLVGSLLVAATACAQTFTADAASVGGSEIARRTVDEAVEAQLAGSPGADDPATRNQLARDVLTGLIRQELLLDAAEREQIEASDEEVDAELLVIRSQFASEADFQQQLQAAGLTLEDLRERLQVRVLQQGLARALAPEPSTADLRAAYQERADSYREIKVKHILYAIQGDDVAAARTKARNALSVLRAGTRSFAALARTSDDPSSADHGGVLAGPAGNRPGWIQVGALDADFGSAAFGARPGGLIGPVRSQFGFHLIVLLDKRTTPFSQVRDELADEIKEATGDAAVSQAIAIEASRANILVNPKYGEWDPVSQTIVPYQSYVPVEPDETTAPPGFGNLPIGN